MTRALLGCALLVSAMVAAPAIAADVGKLVGRSGNWDLHQSQDPMTDEIECTGVHRNSGRAQLSRDRVYLVMRGGPMSARIRFDEEPAEPMRLMSDVERRVGVVQIDGLEFSRFMNARRLRYSISTSVDGVREGDLDLEGVGQAITAVRGRCTPAALASAGLAPVPATAAASAADSTSLCSPDMVGRMRTQRLTAAQIAAICS